MGFIICVVILGWGVVYFGRGKVKNHKITSGCMQPIRAERKLPEDQEDKALDDKLILVEVKKITKHINQEENMGQLQEELIEGLSLRAIKLLEFPPPDIKMEIADIKTGPTSIRGIYKFQKDEKLQISSYLIASDLKNAEPKEWLDLGTFSHETKDVDADTKISTIVQKQISDGKTSLQPEGRLTISSSKVLCYPNGKIISADAIEIDGGGKGFCSTIKKESSTSSNLIFPDHEIKQGQSWQVEDEKNKANKITFKFEGYCTVNGIECMKIAVDSTVTSSVDYKDGWDKQNYQIQCNTHTTGVYYFDYKKGITQLSDLTSEVKIETGLPQNNNTENLAKFFRKVTYVEN